MTKSRGILEGYFCFPWNTSNNTDIQQLSGLAYDNTKKRILYITPAGFTQYSTLDNCNRQKLIESIVLIRSNNKDTMKHNIELIPQPNNRYDPHAIAIRLTGPLSEEFGGATDLGYISKSFNDYLLPNLKYIKTNLCQITGHLIRRDSIDQIFYNLIISIPYLNPEPTTNEIRLRGLVGEV